MNFFINYFSNTQSNGIEIEKAVKDAIDVGYRHIDTAWAYENEYSIGKAVRSKIADGTIKNRSEMFIVTKVSMSQLNALKERRTKCETEVVLKLQN